MAKALRARAIRSFYNVAHVALCISYLFYYIKSCAFCQDLAVFFHKSAIFGGGGGEGEDLGTLSQALLRKLLERSFLRTFKNFKQGDFRSLLFCCADFGVAVFRAAISGCSEPNPVQRDLCSCRFSPLPDKSGRKLVDDRSGATHVPFRLGCVLLLALFLDFVGFDRRLRHKMRVNALQNRCEAVYFVRNSQKDERKYAKILCHIGK